MSEQLKLGQIITTPQQRDAIHIAVAPVVANEVLYKGCRLAFVEGSTERVKSVRHGGIGVIDPFLTTAVQEGQRCWLFLDPGSITSLRHDWTHPAFGPVPAASDDPVADSRKWIEQFAADIDQTYNLVMSAAETWLEDGDWTYDNSESYKDHWDRFPTFWQHYAIVTGKDVPESKRESFFTCSC